MGRNPEFRVYEQQATRYFWNSLRRWNSTAFWSVLPMFPALPEMKTIIEGINYMEAIEMKSRTKLQPDERDAHQNGQKEKEKSKSKLQRNSLLCRKHLLR